MSTARPTPCTCFATGRHYPGVAHLITDPSLVPEFSTSTPWLDLPIAFIDTETTGLRPTEHRIIELGITVALRGRYVYRTAWLFNPAMPIPTDATRIHGISDSDVKAAPSFEDCAEDVLDALTGYMPAAYNAGFDKGFLLAEFGRVAQFQRAGVDGDLPPSARRPVEWLDPLVFARELYAADQSRRLGDMAARLGVKTQEAHRALDDSTVGLEVLLALGRDVRVPRGYGAFVAEQKRLARGWEERRVARWGRRG